MTDYTHNDTAAVDVPEMAATTVAGDLLAALIDELRLIERPWQSLPEVDQQDVIERLRARVKTNVEEAVRTIAADARPVIAADVENCHLLLTVIVDKLGGVASWDHLWHISEAARVPTVMPFGKHKGTPIDKVPADYKAWLLRQPDVDPYLRQALQA